ncbi:hypothetical protein C8Q76DRAFT_751898 [Earliella scabrosa]|nr:hypothetical protein C8Q76DRAFT_751898 [Earliella scabrosa]
MIAASVPEDSDAAVVTDADGVSRGEEVGGEEDVAGTVAASGAVIDASTPTVGSLDVGTAEGSALAEVLYSIQSRMNPASSSA